MSSYKDLTDNVDESFDFVLRGNKYTMRYPTTEELDDIQRLSTEMDGVDTTTPEGREKAKEINDKLADAMYQFITPVEHETSIREAMSKENVKVLRNFNTMIKTELAV